MNVRSSQMMSSPSAQVWSYASMARYLSLNDLCTLSMTCKDWQYSVVTAYSSLAARQLVQALEANSPVLKAEMKFCNLSTECGSNPASQLRQLWTVVSFLRVRAAIPWRPALAATPGVLQDLTLLFNIPQLPRSLVQPLLQQATAPPNNVVMHYQQLMKAAYNRVAGVESWVQAQCQLGILTDIPDMFVKICCGNVAQEELAGWQPPSPNERVDALQIAFNGSHKGTAALAAECLLPQVTDPAAVLHLLQTVVTRRHYDALQSAAAANKMQALTPDAALQLLQIEAKTWSNQEEGSQHVVPNPKEGYILPLLLSLPQVRELTMDGLLPIMQAALRSGRPDAFKFNLLKLSNLSAAKRMKFADCSKLLETAIARNLPEAVFTLCNLPAVSHVSLAMWLNGILTATAPQLASSTSQNKSINIDLAQLLIAAVDYNLNLTLISLNDFVAGEMGIITPGIILRLLEAAWKKAANCQEADAVQKISARLTAVIKLPQLEKHKLINSLVQSCSEQAADVSSVLCAASGIPSNVLAHYIHLAIEQQDCDVLAALINHPSAASFDASAVTQFSNTVAKVKTRRDSILGGFNSTFQQVQQQLCMLPSASSISAE